MSSIRTIPPCPNRTGRPGYDREQWYKDNVQPIVESLWRLYSASSCSGVGGILSLLIGYLRRGRDPQVVVVPTYLTEPPSDESPGVVGVLVDERADMKDIMRTLVDLAQRGYLRDRAAKALAVSWGCLPVPISRFIAAKPRLSNCSRTRTNADARYVQGQTGTHRCRICGRNFTNISRRSSSSCITKRSSAAILKVARIDSHPMVVGWRCPDGDRLWDDRSDAMPYRC